MGGATLTSGRLRFRPATVLDLGILHGHWNRPEVGRYLWDGGPVPEDTVAGALAQSDSDFAESGFGLWIVESASGAEFVGFCGLRVIDGTELVEILYSIEPDRWGHGYATEAARTVLEHAFGAVGLTLVVGGVDAPNVASRRVLERLGGRAMGELVVGGTPTPYWAFTP